MQLDVLAYRQVCYRASVTLRYLSDRAQLMNAQEAVGQGNTHHEISSRFAFAARSADCSSAVTLGVDTPPFEIEIRPFRHHGIATLTGKFPYLGEVLPGIPRALQSLDLLRFRLSCSLRWRNVCGAGHKP